MESHQPGSPEVSPTLVLPDIFNRSNFEYSAFSGLKVDSRRRRRKKKQNRKNNIQVGVNEHNRNKGG